MCIPITDKPTKGSSDPHTDLYCGVRLQPRAKESMRTPMNTLATLWASPRDC